MSAFFGIVRYEYRMSIRRWGIWIAFAIAALPYIIPALIDQVGQPTVPMWAFAGSVVLGLNTFMPIIGGIAMADRLPRDDRLGTRELLATTPLRRHTYVLGKYIGVVTATITPVLVIIVLLVIIISARSLGAVAGARISGVLPSTLYRLLVLRQLGVAPTELPAMTGYFLLAFLVINLPAYLFIGAFSLACPAVLPVRVYQILFVGYWFWGNFLNPKFIPTLAGTLLTPSGEFAADGLFSSSVASGMVSSHTPFEAVLSITVLLACAAAALFVLEHYLAWQARRA